MVHQTIKTRSTSATSASSKINPMVKRFQVWTITALIVGSLAACASRRPPSEPAPSAAETASTPAKGEIIEQARSRWVPVAWSELPGFDADALHDAWNAWLRSCERPGPVFGPVCGEVRQLSIGSSEEQRAWMQARLQPYRVEAPGGGTQGLLTGYYEPMFEASRLPRQGFAVPLYRPPAGLAAGRAWFSRQQIDTLPQAQAALRGQEIAWLADPVDALILQIQGSGRLRIAEPDGSQRLVRLAFAGANEHPYQSVGRWLLDQGLVRDASWGGIKAWVAANPMRLQEMLWSNPRYIFFREEALVDLDSGPRGAQGVALTPGRSIAVDPLSIPYGTPVWLATSGPAANLNRLVLAQDTGSAIVGAVRADYFAGWTEGAGELAGRLKQPLQLWVLWPR
ncbi:MAG: murein transglycosylase A [Hylemonella sp.]